MAAAAAAAAELYRCPGAFATAGTHAGSILRTSGMPLLSLQFPGPLHRQDCRRRHHLRHRHPPPSRAPPPRSTTDSPTLSPPGRDLRARDSSIARANSSVSALRMNPLLPLSSVKDEQTQGDNRGAQSSVGLTLLKMRETVRFD